MELRLWRAIWLCGIIFHFVATPLMYQIWWRVAYRWVYPYMNKSKAAGREFAQPFGEGYCAALRFISDGRMG